MDFDLVKRGGKGRDGKDGREAEREKEKEEVPEYQSTFYNDAEQEKLLLGYDVVSEDAWKLIRPKTHIRYLTKAGDFRRGGFVHNVKLTGKPMIFIETSFDRARPGYAKWPVALEDVATIWAKRTREDVKIEENGRAISERVDEIEATNVDLKLQIAKLQEDVKKLIGVIGKLNDKIVSSRGAAAPASGTSAKY